jgi:hypothetical protein
VLGEPLEQHVAFVCQSMQRGLERLYQRQREATVRRVEGKRGRQMARRFPLVEVGRVFDEAYWRDEIYHWSLCWHEMLFLLVALSFHGRAARLDDPRIRLGVERCARSFAATTAHTVRTRLAASLTDPVGTTAEADLAARVTSVFQGLHDDAAKQARLQVATGCRNAKAIVRMVST